MCAGYTNFRWYYRTDIGELWNKWSGRGRGVCTLLLLRVVVLLISRLQLQTALSFSFFLCTKFRALPGFSARNSEGIADRTGPDRPDRPTGGQRIEIPPSRSDDKRQAQVASWCFITTMRTVSSTTLQLYEYSLQPASLSYIFSWDTITQTDPHRS